MQPRLVAVSYPSAADDGYGSSARQLSQDDEYLNFSTRRSSKWQSFSPSLHGLRGQLPSLKRKQSSATEGTTISSPDPWFGMLASNLHGCRIDFVDNKYISKWPKLPQSVQQRILQYLKPTEAHKCDSAAQQTWRNNLLAFQLSCKGWSEVAQRQLYESIQLRSNFNCKYTSHRLRSPHTRILQLRQTLTSNPRLAILVRRLTLLPEKRQGDLSEESFSDLIASVVMACPKLEKLTTYHVLYTHNSSRFHHALATRTKLTQHTWVIGEDDIVQTRAGKRYKSGILSTQQTQLFLQYHTYWRNLETLSLISHDGKGILEHSLFIRTLARLPSLKNLHVSSFDANDFSDETLLLIPSLRSLQLERCLGVSETGLCQWAESQAAANVQRLVLESQNITSLLTISALFDSLPELETFRLVQLEFEPCLPLELSIQEPLFSSLSLKTLEWYTANGQNLGHYYDGNSGSSGPLSTRALTWPRSKSSQHLLSSILDYGFPQLHRITLPGYDNLAGLLRWLRHSAWATQPTKRRPQRLSTLTNRLSARASLSSRRVSSVRPSSPCFDEYQYWTTPTDVAVPLLPEATKRHKPSRISQADTSTSTSPASATSQTSTQDSPTSSRNRNSSAPSTATSASTPSPHQQTFFKSASGSPRSSLEVGVDDSDSDEVESSRAIFKKTTDATASGSRHSSISVLLDGYAQSNEQFMMSGALAE